MIYYIWVVNIESGGYGGSSNITETVERNYLGCEWDWELWYKIRKRYFSSRKDAEDYIRPIAKLAFETMLDDWESNGDEEDLEIISLYRKRGFHEIKKDELKKDSKYYDMFYSKEESTTYVCPHEHEDDRHGAYFANVKKVTVY